MKKPTVFEEALASILEGYKKNIIEEYDKALREAIKKRVGMWIYPYIGAVLDAIDKAKVEENKP